MTDLKMVEDTQESKFEAIFARAGAELPPVYIISHKRPAVLTLETLPWLKETASVVVAMDQVRDYIDVEAGELLAIPKNFAGFPIGVGRARQYVLETARKRGQAHILLLDDDMKGLTMLYSIGERKVSHAMARAVGDRVEEFRHGLLALFQDAACDAFREAPGAVIASAQCNNPKRVELAAQIMWELNRGGPPAQIQSWRVDRYFDLCPEGLDLERFNYHGDDIGLAAQIVHAGGSVVHVPSVIGHYLDYETQSVIRTPETAPALREAEHEALMGHPLARYVRTRTDVLDRPQWHSMDWARLAREGKTAQLRRYWGEGALL